jgi:nucleoside-diphosphate-sugar epimerase
MAGKIILVTGANGFLGREIVSQFKAAGILLRATDVGSTYAEHGIEYQKADVTKPDELGRAVQGASLIVHAAGLAHIFTPDKKLARKCQQVNEIGTANVVSAAAKMGVEHFILISSVSVYGPYTQGMYSEDTQINPEGPYALSKANAEMRAREIAQRTGMSLTILRLATLYGEGDPGNIGRLMRAIDRRRFFLIGDGSNRKSLLYRGDAARACLTIVSRPATGVNIYNVSGRPCTMLDIVDGLTRALGRTLLSAQIPAHIALAAGKFLSCFPAKRLSGLHLTIKKWLAEDVYDTRHIERDYGFHARIDLIEGLKREVRWYRQGKGNLGQ